MESKKLLVFAIVPPATGHVNPLCCIIHELLKQQQNILVIIYSDERFRKIIEQSGARFRAFSHPTFGAFKYHPINKKRRTFDMLLNDLLSISFDVLPQLIGDVENDQPDMILYDGFFLPVKYLIEVINSRKKRGEWGYKVPKTAGFVPNFPITQKSLQPSIQVCQDDIWLNRSLQNAFKRQQRLSEMYGLSIDDPIKFFVRHNENLNIVAVTNELQPNREAFDKTFRFVGSCVCEELRNRGFDVDAELKSILDMFDESKSRLHSARSLRNDHLKLIYMSLGTVFIKNTFIFEMVIEAIRNFDQQAGRHLSSGQLKVIMAVGEVSFKELMEMIHKCDIILPENIILRTVVPQLEVLKRADLFITHCGMNSTTETIKYAVPVVAIPLEADQPANASRVCDQLSLGVRLDPLNLNAQQIADAVDRVLSQDHFKENMIKMSKQSSGYNGAVDAAYLILDYLNSNQNELNLF